MFLFYEVLLQSAPLLVFRLCERLYIFFAVLLVAYLLFQFCKSPIFQLAYCLFGGMRASLWTDALQSIVMLFSTIILGIFSIKIYLFYVSLILPYVFLSSLLTEFNSMFSPLTILTISFVFQIFFHIVFINVSFK